MWALQDTFTFGSTYLKSDVLGCGLCKTLSPMDPHIYFNTEEILSGHKS
jgi:hypothetical protein